MEFLRFSGKMRAALAVMLATVILLTAQSPVVAVFEPTSTDRDSDLPAIIYHEVEQALSATGKFQLVDRRHRQAVLTEQELALDDLMTGPKLFRFGQLLNADYLLLPTVVERGEMLHIYIKLVDIATGETLYPQAVALDRERDDLAAGVQRAVTALAAHFETKGAVLRVNEIGVAVNLGFRHRMQVDDELAVYRRGEMMVDPMTYQVIGYERRRIALLRVTDVQGQSLALAKKLSGQDVRVDDEVVLLSRSRVDAFQRELVPVDAQGPLQSSRLLLSSRPDRAEAWVDGRFAGVTASSEPLILDIPPGRHVVRLEKRHHQTMRRMVQTAPGDRILTDIRLVPLEGYLFVTTTPPGAEIYLDDQYEGLSPVRISRREAGSHVLWVRRHGWREAHKRVRIRLEETDDLHIKLNPLEDESPDKAPPGMVYVPGGRFIMGRDDGAEDERPAHAVELGGLFIDQREVMVKEFRQFCEVTGHRMPQLPVWAQDNHPMTNVNWSDAAAYAAWAGKRLPTEAEWEYLARELGKRKTIYTDDEEVRRWANIAGDGGRDQWFRTSPVGAFAPNEAGLYDLTGNVYEWCADWYDQRYYSRSVLRKPQGESVGSRRVIRGGCWAFGAEATSPYARAFANPANRSDIIGFRCVRDADR